MPRAGFSQPVVLAAAQDAGGANALIPVIWLLKKRGTALVHSLACAEAVGSFERAGVADRVVPSPQEPLEGWVKTVLSEAQSIDPDLLLLGTAWGESIDKVLLRRLKIPSVSVVDNWCSYRERWLDPRTQEVVYPTRIALPDEVARRQAVDAGLPREILSVTGHPYLEMLAVELKDPFLAAQAQSLRQSWLAKPGASPGKRILLFASESMVRDCKPGTPYDRGYTEVQALEGTLAALQQLGSSQDRKVNIAVKLHPRERLDKFQCGPLAARWLREDRLWLIADQPAWPCLLASDGVIGMTSLFLVEAALAGKRSVSFQPGVQPWRSFIGSELGIVPTVSSPETLARHLDAWWREPFQPFAPIDALLSAADGAARRVAKLLIERVPSPQGAASP